MGSMNAMGWVLCESASECADRLWDLLEELGERSGTDGPTVHAMTSEARAAGEPRYCVHPDSQVDVEFRHDDFREAVLLALAWKASQMDPDVLWRRD